MKKLGFVAVALAALAISGCGEAARPPQPRPPRPPPRRCPAPGAPGPSPHYAATFGVSGAGPVDPRASTAPTQTAAVTATQANYSGGFTALSSCAAVTVSPGAVGDRRIHATPQPRAATGCTITVTGATGTTVAFPAATVADPAGVVLRWYTRTTRTVAADVD